MRKILHVFLVLTILFTGAAGVNADINELSEKDTEAVALISAMNILKADDKNIDKNLNRGDFAEALAKMLCIEPTEFADQIFTDVKPKSQKANYIHALYNAGIITGYQDGSFGIDKNVTYDEAAKLIASVLGYGELAKAKGGYPLGYITVLRDNRVLEGVTYSDDITLKTLARLIYNALNAKMMEQVVFGDRYIYDKNSNNTILGVYHNIYLIKGFVTANRYTSIYEPDTKASADEIEINKELYCYSGNQAEELLGQNVNLYYKKTEDDLRGTVVLITPVKVKRLTVKADDCKGREGNLFKYEKNDKDISIRLKQGLIFIYNNRSYNGFSDADFMPHDGDLTFFDTDEDGTYDMVKAFVPLSMPVRYSTDSEGVITLYDGSRIDLSRQQYKYVTLYRMGRLESEFRLVDMQEIVPEDTFSVYVSKDGMYVLGYALENLVTGYITEYNYEDKEISIDNIKYNFIGDIWTKDLIAGSVIDVYLDRFSNAVYYKETKGGKYGYLIEAAYSKDIDKRVRIKILDDTGKINVLNLKDKIYLDGEIVSADLSYFTGKQQLIKYELSKEGDIRLIDTGDISASNQYDILKKHNDPQDFTYYQYSWYMGFSWDIRLSASTKIFMVPLTAGDYTDDDYSLCRTTALTHNKIYNVQGFDLDDSLCAGAVVWYYAPEYKPTQRGVDFYSTIAVYQRTSDTVNDDGEPVKSVTVFEGDSYKKYIVEPTSAAIIAELNKLTEGDTIIFQLNSKGYLGDLKFLYSIKDHTLKYTVPGLGSMVNTNAILYGRAYSVENGFLVISGAPYTDDPADGPFYVVALSRGSRYFVNNGNISVANDSDIICAKYSSTPSYVMVKTYSGDVFTMVVSN